MSLNDFITLHLDLINLKINKKKSKICLNKDCKIEACFNYKFYKEINIRKHSYCKIHKLNNMVNIKDKKCISCLIKQPNFNYINKKIALYCGDCKLESMIDIKNKKCINCKTKQPSCNYKNEKNALYCSGCKLENMVNIINKKCIICLIKLPTFNYEGKKNALYCGDCKLENMINTIDKKCKTYLCYIQVKNKKYKGYCLRCFVNTFPESIIIRDYGTRESKVIEFIKKEFSDLNINYNKQIQGGCSDHRPDIFIDCLTHSLIIEVDEHQHKRGNVYSTRCEIRRINELFTSLADRPIVFIRFNPDSYINSKNKLIKSCFEYTEERGLPKANKTLQPRLNKLKKEIEKNIKIIPNINITTIKLYYDEF